MSNYNFYPSSYQPVMTRPYQTMNVLSNQPTYNYSTNSTSNYQKYNFDYSLNRINLNSNFSNSNFNNQKSISNHATINTYTTAANKNEILFERTKNLDFLKTKQLDKKEMNDENKRLDRLYKCDFPQDFGNSNFKKMINENSAEDEELRFSEFKPKDVKPKYKNFKPIPSTYFVKNK